ncbi:1-acyl-sn-glycerol-3-phosphate acyltransferase [Telluria beijingensis]|uniref:1-acyl-sn-glycerol-3-phosphate acyltransferase n=1 Tax=Telluria beijingensis TaxID=3068633 RepID=UPI0027960B56|nr:1-acyl-sn-glycerol-3-phosphate acyltransferase [Massilia sp. REN29]
MSDYLQRTEDLPTLRQRTALRVLQLFGWKVYFKPLPGPHGIAVVYPHTSNWDFPIGLVAKWALDTPFRWLAKDSLFRGTMGRLMRYWGGIAVDRRAPMGATRQLAQQMLKEDWCWVGITPEGTRGYRPHWKSGFYHLARSAGVPLLLVSFDYKKKELRVVDTLELSGDVERDMDAIRAVYEGVTALYPQNAAPIQLAPRDEAERKRA